MFLIIDDILYCFKTEFKILCLILCLLKFKDPHFVDLKCSVFCWFIGQVDRPLLNENDD